MLYFCEYYDVVPDKNGCPDKIKRRVLTMKKKKIVSIICALSMLASLAACTGETDKALSETDTSGSSVVNAADKDYSGKTVAGKVTAIDGSVVALQLGELSENAEGNTPPEKPSGDAGENANSAPEASGSSNTQNTPPERPAGESSDSQATPSEKPSGSPGSAQTFTAGNENTTVDLSTAKLTKNSETISVSDIKENDILKITFDNSNFASLVEVVAVGGAAGWE